MSEQGEQQNDGANNANSGGEQEQAASNKVEFSPEQQKEIDRLIGKTRREAAEKARNDANAEQQQANEQARRDRETKDLEAKGKFEEAKTALTTERDTAKSEADTLRTENEQLRDAMKTGVDAKWSALPENVRKQAEKLIADDNILGRWSYLNDPDTQALVKDFEEKGANGTYRGNQPGPRSNGNAAPTLTDTTNEMRRMRGLPARQ